MKNEEELKKIALDLRKMTVREIAHFGGGHIGGSMSIIEILTYLYYEEMNIDPKNPLKKDRDRFVCSKGHAGPAVYATLANKGFFSKEELNTLNLGGTKLPSHCDMTKTPGIDFTAGSLGQGISAAVGIALGQKIKEQGANTFAIIGDGESQEGEVWEAAETAAQWKLDNLFVFTDLNHKQLDGWTDDIINMKNLDTRWVGFNWDVQRINGHNFIMIQRAIEEAKKVKDKPHMIILDTIKSYGYIPAENLVYNHGFNVSEKEGEEAISLLEKREGK